MRAVNLLPREAPKSRRRLGLAGQLAIVSPLVLAAVLGAGYLVTTSQVNDRRAELQVLQDEIAALPSSQTPATEVDPQLAAQHEARVSALAAALRSRIAWDRILRQVSSVLPEDVWLLSLNAQSPGVTAPPTPPVSTGDTGEQTPTTPAPTSTTPANALVITGYTYSQEGVARFLSRLAVIPELNEVRLIQSAQVEIAGRLVVQFEINAGIRRQEAS